LKVLVGENHYYEHDGLQGLDLAVRIQVFYELFVPHHLFTSKAILIYFFGIDIIFNVTFDVN